MRATRTPHTVAAAATVAAATVAAAVAAFAVIAAFADIAPAATARAQVAEDGTTGLHGAHLPMETPVTANPDPPTLRRVPSSPP